MPFFPVHRSAKTAGLVMALSCLLVPYAGSASAASGVVLRYHFSPGQSVNEVELSTTITDIKATVGSGSSAQPMLQHSVEKDRFPVTLTATKINADGSALLRVDFGVVTIITNGKRQDVPLKHYYRIVHVAADGAVLSSQTFGAKTLPPGFESSLPSVRPTKYSLSPVAVGSTWTDSQKVEPFGLLTLTYKLLALGSHNGHATATLHVAIARPGKLQSNGLLFDGSIVGSEDAQIVVDTGADVLPSRTMLQFKGKLSGIASGLPVKGVFNLSISGGIGPQ